MKYLPLKAAFIASFVSFFAALPCVSGILFSLNIGKTLDHNAWAAASFTCGILALASFALTILVVGTRREVGKPPLGATLGATIFLAALLLTALVMNFVVSQDPMGSIFQFLVGAVVLLGWLLVPIGAIFGLALNKFVQSRT